ncbi:MAG: hypothetical protein F4Y27_10075 [Acidimicrobiaceae bacterium]|nr:hypothetical protein [Acidimicrobiaceae bacterium]MYA75014.1 hypothetical protein [Acidimicrobiaceae bacterium]MYC41160.1 hypothetical protein [Acidimicrobiaceae bacterium]MYG55418.1 hypothetical protein [Acidimicrobiaceae bacterium]MYH87506.1 hypothetical protein [Acidimicrobiaceae bacterium]
MTDGPRKRHLLYDPNLRAHYKVAGDPDSPQWLLAELASGEYSVRRIVAANPRCPEEAMLRLAGDETGEVRETAAANPSCPQWLLGQLAVGTDVDAKSGVAANPSCPPLLLARLANASGPLSWKVRCAAAKNPSTPADAVLLLAEDEDWRVRWEVANNPNCPPEALTILAEDDDVDLRAYAAGWNTRNTWMSRAAATRDL